MGIVNALHSEGDKYEKLDKELLGFIEDVLLNRRVCRRLSLSVSCTGRPSDNLKRARLRRSCAPSLNSEQ